MIGGIHGTKINFHLPLGIRVAVNQRARSQQQYDSFIVEGRLKLNESDVCNYLGKISKRVEDFAQEPRKGFKYQIRSCNNLIKGNLNLYQIIFLKKFSKET